MKMVRHMILNSVRMYRTMFNEDYDEDMVRHMILNSVTIQEDYGEILKVNKGGRNISTIQIKS